MPEMKIMLLLTGNLLLLCVILTAVPPTSPVSQETGQSSVRSTQVRSLIYSDTHTHTHEHTDRYLSLTDTY